MTLRPVTCPCGHPAETHYADDRGVRWARCARGCDCGRYGARYGTAPIPVRSEPAAQADTLPPPEVPR